MALKGNVRHYVLLQLDGDSSFHDLDSLLQKYFNNTCVQTESSLNSVWGKAWRDKNQAKEQRGKGSKEGKGKKLNPHYEPQAGGKDKNIKAKEKAKESLAKGKGEAYPSQPPFNKGKGKQQQLPNNPEMVQHMLQKGASCTSLLVESGSLPAAVTAPERSSLANK